MRRIQNVPLTLRPREKLLKSGPTVLSLAELIAVILITGTKTSSVLKLAKQIADILPSKLSADKLKQLGLGPTKISQILAVVEISQRLSKKSETPTLTRPEDVFAHSYEIIRSDKESLLCFYLNARGELIKKEVIAMGSLNQAQLLPREIFSVIKDLPVASIILVHNHPSGVLEPSQEDILFTKRVRLAGEILGVTLLDHLIVSPKGFKRINI